MPGTTDLRVQNYAACSEMAPHAHQHTSFSIVVAGSLVERIGRSERNYARGNVSLFPCGVTHSQVFGAAGARQIIVAAHPSWIDYFAECGVRLSDAPHVQGNEFRPLGDRLLEEMARTDRYSAFAREGILFELVAAFGRADALTGAGRLPPAWLRRTRDFLHAHADRPIGMREMAAIAGRHEIHVAREFRRHFGRPVGDYLRRLRTERAAQLLVESDHGISAIALDCGFANHSHLCREFRRSFGVTPSQYRRSRKD